jgi:hypothetical protein
MKSTSRLLTILTAILVVLILLNAIPYVQKKFGILSATSPAKPGQHLSLTAIPFADTPSPTPTPTITLPAALTVNGKQWGQSTCYIGATEGSSRFTIADLEDLGINAYHIYGGMSRWEAQDDSNTYGYPTSAQIKANPNVINWKQWDTVMTNPPSGSDYWWEPAPRWQGNARTLFSELEAAHITVVLDLRNRDDQNQPAWSPNPPVTTADWNEWWEHVFATVYWLDVRNHYNVTDFEVLNEPNIPHQGWTPQATEAQYFTLMEYTYDAINYVFHTYLPGQTYHILAPATSGGNWPEGILQHASHYFDSMDIHAYGNFQQGVQIVHHVMSSAGYSNEPLWITEWGSYQRSYNSAPFGISLINDLITGSSPGNDYVYGSTIFALYDYSTNYDGLIDYKGNRRIDYYALRMGIQALQGCRPTYQSSVNSKDLLAITTVDASNNIYLLVTNKNAQAAYTVKADLSALRMQATGTMWQFDANHLDSVVGTPSLINGTAAFTIPANSAVLLRFFPARSLQKE